MVSPSLPSRERELKHIYVCLVVLEWESLPSRERELKHPAHPRHLRL